jgi:hypothetical protein
MWKTCRISVELVQPEIFIGLSWGPISRKCMFFVGPPQKKHGFRIQEPHVSPFLENNIYYYLYIYIYIYVHFGCLWGLINKTQIISTKSKQKRPAGPDVIHFWKDLKISQETKLEDGNWWKNGMAQRPRLRYHPATGDIHLTCCCGCSSKVPHGI